MVSRRRSEINDDYSKATNAQNNRLQQQMNCGANDYCGDCVTTENKGISEIYIFTIGI
jgi:hypothetical protein